MRMFDVQGIEMQAPRRKVFEFVRDPATCRNGLTHLRRPGMVKPGSIRPQERLMCGSVSRLMRRPAL